MKGAEIKSRQEVKVMLEGKKKLNWPRFLEGTEVARAVERFRGRALSEAGGAVLEMAISSSVLFAMFFGVFQFSFASYTYHYVSDAAREGARYAIVRGSTSCVNTPNLSNCNASSATIGNYVKNLGYPGIDSTANMTVTTTWLTATTDTSTGTTLTTWAACGTAPCNLPGSMANVVVAYAFPLRIPFVPARTINVTSTSQMVVQQ